jgi:hypothetical protein
MYGLAIDLSGLKLLMFLLTYEKKKMARKTKKLKSENFSRVFVLLVVSMLAVIIYCSFYLNKRFDHMKIQPVLRESNKSFKKNDLHRNYLQRKSVSTNYNIIFIETNQNNSVLSPRQLCAIESAAYRNPSASVVLYTLFPKEGNYSFLLDHYPGLSIKGIFPETLFNNTPLLEWYKQGLVFKSRFAIVHISDATRLALLLKHGGFYSDLDTIALKSFESLTKYNGAGYLYENYQDSMGSGFLCFQANHSFLNYIMQKMVEKYNPDCWGCNGPTLLISSMKGYCKSDDIFSELLMKPPSTNRAKLDLWVEKKMQALSKCDLTIFPERYFYPFTIWKLPGLPALFKLKSDVSMDMIADTFSVHFYGSATSKYKVKPGDGSFFDILAASNCPRVYEHVKSSRHKF